MHDIVYSFAQARNEQQQGKVLKEWMNEEKTRMYETKKIELNKQEFVQMLYFLQKVIAEEHFKE